jgi:hypothetical protein
MKNSDDGGGKRDDDGGDRDDDDGTSSKEARTWLASEVTQRTWSTPASKAANANALFMMSHKII